MLYHVLYLISVTYFIFFGGSLSKDKRKNKSICLWWSQMLVWIMLIFWKRLGLFVTMTSASIPCFTLKHFLHVMMLWKEKNVTDLELISNYINQLNHMICFFDTNGGMKVKLWKSVCVEFEKWSEAIFVNLGFLSLKLKFCWQQRRKKIITVCPHLFHLFTSIFKSIWMCCILDDYLGLLIGGQVITRLFVDEIYPLLRIHILLSTKCIWPHDFI